MTKRSQANFKNVLIDIHTRGGSSNVGYLARAAAIASHTIVKLRATDSAQLQSTLRWQVQ